MSELDVIGTICGTDKSSAITWSWDYLRHYEQLFYKFKSEPINIIEIGVLGGSSIETWKRYFDRATIIGIDIDPACLRFAGDRVIIRIGSQENPEFLQSVTRDHQPSIVIDDGSHLAHHMIASFEALFPALAPGGLYVFEDLSFHFADGVGQWQGASAHQGDSEKSIYDYLSPFIRARMANLSTPQGAWGFTKYAMENIDSVTAFGGVLVVRKRAPRPCEADIAAFERILAKGEDGPPAALHYAAYLVRHDVHHERAFGLLRAHAERDSQDIFALDMLHTMAVRLDRPGKSLEAAVRIAALRPFESASWHRIAAAQRRLNQPGQELIALRRLVELDDGAAEAWGRISALCEQAGDMEAARSAAHRVCDLFPGDADALHRLRSIESRMSSVDGQGCPSQHPAASCALPARKSSNN